jgi:hypothetical protein
LYPKRKNRVPGSHAVAVDDPKSVSWRLLALRKPLLS